MTVKELTVHNEENPQLNAWIMSIFFSNLQKASEKQRRLGAARLYAALADSFAIRAKTGSAAGNGIGSSPNGGPDALTAIVAADLERWYPAVFETAAAAKERGPLRAATWGKKATAIHKTLISRYLLQETDPPSQNIHICEACGFISVGDNPPAICPVCKAPASRFSEIQEGK